MINSKLLANYRLTCNIQIIKLESPDNSDSSSWDQEFFKGLTSDLTSSFMIWIQFLLYDLSNLILIWIQYFTLLSKFLSQKQTAIMMMSPRPDSAP